jgi:hypothetical protein
MAAEMGAGILASAAVVSVAGAMEGVAPPRSLGVLAVRGRPEGVGAYAIDVAAG